MEMFVIIKNQQTVRILNPLQAGMELSQAIIPLFDCRPSIQKPFENTIFILYRKSNF